MSLTVNQLGETGINVTRLGFGAMEFRKNTKYFDYVPEKEANTILNMVLDAGINFIDTSIDYGESEELIGKSISHRRSEFVLATKCSCPVGMTITGGGKDHVYTRDRIVAGINQSLKRMKTDYLDLVQLHGSPSIDVINELEVIETLNDVKQEGKIRFIGVSTSLPMLAQFISLGFFDAFQIPYSALNRTHEDWISKSFNAGIGTIIRGGVSKGEFVSKGLLKQEASWREMYKTQYHEWDYFTQAGLDDLLEEGESKTSFLLRFTLSHPELNTTIVGTANQQHFKDNIATANKGILSEEIYLEAKKRLDLIGISPSK
tara:strand:+ start:415 stop:1365 length:951 start_codon:yes stop_codon:yes gene_type:complete